MDIASIMSAQLKEQFQSFMLRGPKARQAKKELMFLQEHALEHRKITGGEFEDSFEFTRKAYNSLMDY